VAAAKADRLLKALRERPAPPMRPHRTDRARSAAGTAVSKASKLSKGHNSNVLFQA
jgi:hypothetical protein